MSYSTPSLVIKKERPNCRQILPWKSCSISTCTYQSASIFLSISSNCVVVFQLRMVMDL
jgi:hypothetical protein